MAIAILLIMLGLAGPIASIQWRRGEWLPAGRWVMRTLSPHAVAAATLAGLVVSMIGLSTVWPPAVILAFLAALAFVGALVASVNGDRMGRVPPALRPAARVPFAPHPVARPSDQRRAG
jgi:Ca2+/Na+ antiporter